MHLKIFKAFPKEFKHGYRFLTTYNDSFKKSRYFFCELDFKLFWILVGFNEKNLFGKILTNWQSKQDYKYFGII